MKKLFLLIPLLTIYSCGRGDDGLNGDRGDAANYSSRILNLESDCFVSTGSTCLTNDLLQSDTLTTNDFSVIIPAFIDIDNASVSNTLHNGYVTLKVGSLIYCFQRKNQASTDPILRRRHDLVGMKFSGTCSTGVDSTIIRTEISSDDAGLDVELTVHGPFAIAVPTTFTAQLDLEIKVIE